MCKGLYIIYFRLLIFDGPRMFTRAGIIIKKNNLSGNLLRAARSGWHTFLMPTNPLKTREYNITVTDDEIGLNKP